MNTKINLDKFLKIINLNNTFLGLGFILMIIGIIGQYESGTKLGVITLFFGGVFRVLNIVSSAIPRQNRKNPTFKLFLFAVGKFCMYLIGLMLYLYFVNMTFKIF